jgi:lipoprotein-anchoring transpeptidase ErfK/SrfK
MLNAIMIRHSITRRDFLKLFGLGMTSMRLLPNWDFYNQVDFPSYDRLGRVCVGMVDIKSGPSEDSQTVGVLYEDGVVPWLKEVVGNKPYYINQKWVETSDGFIYAPYLQPVRNLPNNPVDSLLQMSMGEGIWAEVTIPYADVILENGPSSNSWVHSRLDQGLPLRVYYGQVFWVDRIKADELGNIYYRVNPNYYGGVDLLWVPAEAMRQITADEIAPINPNIENKHISVDVNRQTLSCYEADTEVYFCRVSTGAKYDAYGNPVDRWSTPIGTHMISRKYISLQMSGGTTGAGYDLPGIGWTSIFSTGGVAIHATIWHNDFGTPRSHGCVNAMPADAKWIFRWSQPNVPYDPGMNDVTVSGDNGTTVEVVES